MDANRFCSACYYRIRHEISDYMPRPGYSKPGRFIVAGHLPRAGFKPNVLTVCRTDAITIAISRGNWMKAKMMVEDSMGKRYNVKDLKFKQSRQPSQQLPQSPLHQPQQKPPLAAPARFSVQAPRKQAAPGLAPLAAANAFHLCKASGAAAPERSCRVLPVPSIANSYIVNVSLTSRALLCRLSQISTHPRLSPQGLTPPRRSCSST